MKTKSRFLVVLALSIGLCLSAAASEIDDAIKKDDVAKVKAMLAKGCVKLNHKNEAGQTPLNLAANEGKTKIAAMLLKAGADMTIGDFENSQPIHCAALSGHIDVVDLLLANGADINVEDDNGVTPLHFSLSYKQSEMAQHLINKGADVNLKNKNGWPALLYAVINGDEKVISMLLAKGADVNAKTTDGLVPLHSAASYGRMNIFKLLVDGGADIHAMNNNGETPLGWALNENTREVVEYLIENGADVRQKDKEGRIPLHHVCRKGSVGIAKIHLKHGADINLQDNDGRSPLSWAAFAGPEIVKFLIEQGADVNPPNKGYEFFASPLQTALRMAKPEVCKILLENGADVDVKNFMGATPLHMAVLTGNPDLVEALLKNKCSIDEKEDKGGRTALHAAAILGYAKIADQLIAQGADVKAHDHANQTALDYALYFDFRELACLLADHGADKSKIKGLENRPRLLERELDPGEAVVWHLGHSGWAVKTQNHLLVFDYFSRGDRQIPEEASLSSGYICPKELKNQNVCVFASHAHGDHYSESIFDWKKKIPNCRYVLGFQPQNVQHDYTLIGPRSKKVVDGMNVSTIKSNDSGVGFLVHVDGVTLFHAGDHANRLEDMSGPYPAEIDYLADMNPDLNLAFFPISGCGFGAPENVCKGVIYALEKLKPDVFFPMHAADSFYKYQEFADNLADKHFATEFACATNKGYRYIYSEKEKTISSLD